MERTTKQQVANVFAQLTAKLAANGVDTTHYALDYAPIYGGYRIVDVDQETGAQATPYGNARRPAREMVDAMRFALDILYQVHP